jgi:carbonic anhydrase/acetyltransferase-like protein (isoleucine patch superfamily)
MEIPPGSVVLGVPARVVREVDDTLRLRIQTTWRHYVEQARRHQAGEVQRRTVPSSLTDM